MLAIIAKITCGKECQIPNTGLERLGGAIYYVVTYNRIVYSIQGCYKLLQGAIGQNKLRRPTTGYYNLVSPILI